MIKSIIIIFLAVFSTASFSGNKSDLVDAIVRDCKLNADSAAKFATPGRTGTIIKFKICTTPEIKLADDCVVSCKSKSGNVVGN